MNTRLFNLLLVVTLTFFWLSPLLQAENWQNIRLNNDEIAANYTLACSDKNNSEFLEELKETWLERIAEESPEEPHPAAEELAAISYYRSEAYTQINAYLRFGTSTESDSPETIMAITRLICSGLNKMPASQHIDQNVFRGVWLKAEDIEKQYAVGAVVTEKAFVSTAIGEHIADEFAFGAEAPFMSVVFEIEHKTGVLVVNYLTMEDMFESEVLFPPGTRFKVISHVIDGGQFNYTRIKMVKVP